MKNSLFIIILLFTILPVQAKHLYKEKVYQEYWCNKNNGTMEYRLQNGARVDCLLPDMAVEFDFAKKHAECLGQALEYSANTKRPPACCLIVETEKDYKYVRRIRYTIQKKGLDVNVFTIKPSTLIKAGILSEYVQ